MSDNCAYIYIINNLIDNYKMLLSSDILDINSVQIFQLQNSLLKFIYKQLQQHLRQIYINDIYDENIIEHINQYLNSLGIQYKKMTQQEFNLLIRYQRFITNISNVYNRKLFQQINSQHHKFVGIIKLRQLFIRKYQQLFFNQLINHLQTQQENHLQTQQAQLFRYQQSEIQPRQYQQEIIDIAIEYFQFNDKGLLVLVCAFGKTLTSQWITQRLNHQRIIIGVPNKQILYQWLSVIKKIFYDHSHLLVQSGVTNKNISQFLINNQKLVIITTYKSSKKIAQVTTDYMFDMKILDEVHHLTTSNMELAQTTKSYIHMLNIPSKKQLGLTATIKQVYNQDDNESIISNDNIGFFGEVIASRTLLWAINKNIVCDYILQIIITNEQLLKDFNKYCSYNENNELLVAAYSSLQTIRDGHSHHILVYTNDKQHAEQIIICIQALINQKFFNIKKLSISNYDSSMTTKQQDEIINNFNNSRYGIISCVYCLGEGYDNPLIDAVIFAENMTSNIRILQSALRACRKNINEPNKIMKIIIPVLQQSDQDFIKVKQIIYQIGQEDENIIHKIKAYDMQLQKSKNINQMYDQSLTTQWIKQTELILSSIKRSEMKFTYNKAKKIILQNNVRTKQEYYQLCDNDERFQQHPEIYYKQEFINWLDYLSISREYYNLTTCRMKIQQLKPQINNILNLNDVCYQLCQLDNQFPPYDLWSEYYGVNQLQDIFVSVQNRKRNNQIV